MYLNISEQGAINIFGKNCRRVPAAKGAEYKLARFSKLNLGELGNLTRCKQERSCKQLTCHIHTPASAPARTGGLAQACTAAEGSWHTAPSVPDCKLWSAPQCTSQQALSCTPAVAQRGTASSAPSGISAR